MLAKGVSELIDEIDALGEEVSNVHGGYVTSCLGNLRPRSEGWLNLNPRLQTVTAKCMRTLGEFRSTTQKICVANCLYYDAEKRFYEKRSV